MKKYAIYRSVTGYYFYRYYDEIDQLDEDRLRTFVTEDMLPVIVDERGNFYRFQEDDYGFVRITESDKDCPLRVEEMFFKNSPDFKLGWISPDGDTYSCDYTGHTKAAKYLSAKFYPNEKLPERALLKAGWLKVIDSWNGTQREHRQFVYSLNGCVTKRQVDTLFDIGLYSNEEVKALIRDNEGFW